jgi:hypothetical protein
VTPSKEFAYTCLFACERVRNSIIPRMVRSKSRAPSRFDVGATGWSPIHPTTATGGDRTIRQVDFFQSCLHFLGDQPVAPTAVSTAMKFI